MTSRGVGAVAIVVALAAPAFAHRLDEYLQATIVSIEEDRVHALIRLAPGVAVAPAVLADIDRDADGSVSPAELRAYAQRVLADVSLRIDGQPLALRLVSTTASEVQELREGRGDVRLEVEARVPPGGVRRQLRFENHHRGAMSVYLANCLVPSDPRVQITAQRRSEDQSVYAVDYDQAVDPPGRRVPGAWTRILGGLGAAAVALAALAMARKESER